MEFKVGDKAVYPAHGVGEIISIEQKEIAGQPMSFYVLKILDTDMTIMVPTNNVKSVGLREIIPKRKVKSVYDILKSRDVSLDVQTWNRRYREYTKKIRTGSVFEIAEVLRDLVLLKDDKELSFGEKKMLDTAKNLLTTELSIATRSSIKSVEKHINVIFNAT